MHINLNYALRCVLCFMCAIKIFEKVILMLFNKNNDFNTFSLKKILFAYMRLFRSLLVSGFFCNYVYIALRITESVMYYLISFAN